MKAKIARGLLENLSGDDLYKEATNLYRKEVEGIVDLRSHSKRPTRGIIDSALKQVNDWFLKVTNGLNWLDPELPNKIIEWERGEIWIKHGILDSKIMDWRKRTQRSIMRGDVLPMLQAMETGDLEAASSLVMAKIRHEVLEYEEIQKSREEFAKKYGLKLCPFCEEERFCEHQITYSLVKGIPTNINQLVFVCKTDRCIKKEK